MEVLRDLVEFIVSLLPNGNCGVLLYVTCHAFLLLPIIPAVLTARHSTEKASDK